MRVACMLHIVVFTFLGGVGNVAWIAFVDSPTQEFALFVLTPLVKMAIAFAMFGFVAGFVAAILHANPSEHRYTRTSLPILWAVAWALACAVPGAAAGIAVAWVEFGFLSLLPRLTLGLLSGACVGTLVSAIVWQRWAARVRRLR